MNKPTDASWYPSCVVKLTIRYDEALQVSRPRDEVSLDAFRTQTQQGRISGSNPGTPLNASGTPRRPRRSLDDAARAQANASLAGGDQRLPSQTATPGDGAVSSRVGGVTTKNVEPVTFGTDGFTVIANRVPKKGTFTLPHPRQAPTFSLTFDYAEFPIDPQLLRAVGVEIHLGSVSADNFARGMRGEVDEDGRPLSILKTTTDFVDQFTGRKDVNNATLLFYGTADTWDVDHGENGSTLTLDGREIRAILLDTKITASTVGKVKLNQPIVDVVSDLIQSIPFENSFRLTTATLEQEWPNGIVPSPGDVDGMTAVRVKAASRPGAKVKQASGGQAGVQNGEKATSSTPDNGAKANYWDLITNYCELVGAMPHIVGSMLWIRPIHRIFDIIDPNSKIPTPFAGSRPRDIRTSGDLDEQIRVRRLVVGRDVKRIKIQRKFGGVSIVPSVQTISFDDTKAGVQRLIFGQWPPVGSDAAEAKASSEVLRVPMWGIRSTARLTQIARGIYEEMGRGEVGGTVETGNLSSFGGDNDDPDMVRLRPLDPVEFVIDTSRVRTGLPIRSDVTELAKMTFEQEVEQLHRALGDKALARAFVALSRGAVREVLRYYQVVGVTFTWDKGLRTEAQFQNYIIPRHFASDSSDVNQSLSNGVSAKDAKVAGSNRKAKAKPVKLKASDFTQLSRVVSGSGVATRPRFHNGIDKFGLTRQERGGRGLQ